MRRFTKSGVIVQSLYSLLILSLFVVLGLGCYLIDSDFIKQSEEHIGDGIYKVESYTQDRGAALIEYGRRDKYNRKHGKYLIFCEVLNNPSYSEEVTYVNGEMDGKLIRTWVNNPNEQEIECYRMGHRTNCEEKSGNTNPLNQSAFSVLENNYPWYLYRMMFFGIAEDEIKTFLDAVELELNAQDFDFEEFDDYYDNTLEDTPIELKDSILDINSKVAYLNGIEGIKSVEFRLAIIDKYIQEKSSTWEVTKSVYPGYVQNIMEEGVTEADFKTFYQDFDGLLTSYGPLNSDDQFFVDSLDNRIYRALVTLSSSEKSALLSWTKLKSVLTGNANNVKYWRENIQPVIKQVISNLSPKDVANIVLKEIILEYDKGDMLKQAVKDAYILNKAIVTEPVVVTELDAILSATSINLNAYVLNDGGSPVTSRGMVWASYYNPTLSDQKVVLGSGTGSFTANLKNLSPEIVYYARAFATNSKGTAYGNCVKLVASSIVGITGIENEINEFEIYPNPASEKVTFQLSKGRFDSGVLTIINLSGQLALQTEIDNLLNGDNKIHLDISNLENGIYTCVITHKGKVEAKGKLSIIR